MFQALGATHKCAVNNAGDPIAQYDKLANRWVLTQFSVTGGPPFYQCVAVSTTSDATGSYNVYAFQQPNFNDYPKLGVWPDAYYVSYNMLLAVVALLAGGFLRVYQVGLSGGAVGVVTHAALL